MFATTINKMISMKRLLPGAAMAVLLSATAQAAAPGITGTGGGAGTFNLTAQPAFVSQPDGQSVYSWGYGCSATGGAPTFVPATIATTPAGGPAGRRASLRLGANVDYLVCEVDCVPYRYDLVLDQPLGERAEIDPQTAPLLDRWWRQVPLAAGRGMGPAGTPALASRAEMTLARTASPGKRTVVAGPVCRIRLSTAS